MEEDDKELNIRELKALKYDIELRDIYWHVGIINWM